MSVLIKGMTLPQNCFYCEIMHKTEDGEWMKCPLAGFKYRMHDMYTYVSELTQPHPDCPLVALPEKHGRLIDADALESLKRVKLVYGEECVYFKTEIDAVPTILEAEDKE